MPTPLVIHGFDQLSATAGGDLGVGITAGAGTVTETATNVRTGDSCLRISKTGTGDCSASIDNGGGGATSTPPWPTGIRTHSQVVSLFVGTLPSQTTNIYGPSNGAVESFEMWLDNAGALVIRNFGATASATVGTLVAGQRYRIEVQCDRSASPFVFSCRINGGPVTTITWAATPEDSVSAWFGNKFHATEVGTYDVYFDDFVAFSGLLWPGDYRVQVIRPDSVPADLDANWTLNGAVAPRANCIKEVTPDDAATFISSVTANQIQRTEMTTVTLLGRCDGVQGYGRMGSTAATARAATVVLQNAAGTDSGTTFSWSAAINGFQGATAISVWPLNPAGTAWKQPDIDAVRFKFTHDATVNLVEASTVWVYLAVSLETPPAPAVTRAISLLGKVLPASTAYMPLKAVAPPPVVWYTPVAATPRAPIPIVAASAVFIPQTPGPNAPAPAITPEVLVRPVVQSQALLPLVSIAVATVTWFPAPAVTPSLEPTPKPLSQAFTPPSAPAPVVIVWFPGVVFTPPLAPKTITTGLDVFAPPFPIPVAPPVPPGPFLPDGGWPGAGVDDPMSHDASALRWRYPRTQDPLRRRQAQYDYDDIIRMLLLLDD